MKESAREKTLTVGTKLGEQTANSFKAYCERHNTSANELLGKFVRDCIGEFDTPYTTIRPVKNDIVRNISKNGKGVGLSNYYIDMPTYYDIKHSCIEPLQHEIMSFGTWAFYHCVSEHNDLTQDEVNLLRNDINDLVRSLDGIKHYIKTLDDDKS